MSGDNTKESHEERTAAEPRDWTKHHIVVAHIRTVGDTIRVIRFEIPDEGPDIKFLPGQWVDTYCPGLAKAGGFTLTSSPSEALGSSLSKGASSESSPKRSIELAIRESPDNPAAAWLWQTPPSTILGQSLRVRVGGSFVYPPAKVQHPHRVVFLAGGVGINPLMSMVRWIGEKQTGRDQGSLQQQPPEVTFLYSWREETEKEAEKTAIDGSRILFLDELAALFGEQRVQGKLKLFLTGGGSSSEKGEVVPYPSGDVPVVRRRISKADVDLAVQGSSSASPGTDKAYVYVCGVPDMTDAFVAHLRASAAEGGLGLPRDQILFEKWW